jgi:hypothetical protein
LADWSSAAYVPPNRSRRFGGLAAAVVSASGLQTRKLRAVRCRAGRGRRRDRWHGQQAYRRRSARLMKRGLTRRFHAARCSRRALAAFSDLTGDGYVTHRFAPAPDPSVTPARPSTAAERYWRKCRRTNAPPLSRRAHQGDIAAGEGEAAHENAPDN